MSYDLLKKIILIFIFNATFVNQVSKYGWF